MNAERSSIKRRAKQTVVSALKLHVEPDEISDGEALFGDGVGAASIAALEVVFAIEEEFGFEVDDEELRMELFESIDSIVDYIEGKLADPQV